MPEERHFELSLSHEVAQHLGTYATIYRHLVERLGAEVADGLWNALPGAPDTLMRRTLALNVRPEDEALCGDGLSEGVRDVFASPVRGITAKEATGFLRGKPPFAFVAAAVPENQGILSVTTHEWLHLFRDPLARIAEEAGARYGKAGELIIYDALCSEAAPIRPISADEFMRQRLARYQSQPQTPNAFSTGLDIDLVRGDGREIVAHVTRCEWAHYYREYHPSVGYLLACSTDDPMYRRLCEGVRFQRRSTLMEGGAYCEFCFYRTDIE